MKSANAFRRSIVQVPNMFDVNIFLQQSASNADGPDPPFHFHFHWCANFVEQHSFCMNCAKQCGNCAFPQHFHTRKLGEILVFYAVFILKADLLTISPSISSNMTG